MSSRRRGATRLTPDEKALMNMDLLPELGNVQVYKDGFDLLVFTYQILPGMNREYRYTLGEEMKTALQEMLTSIYEARKTVPRCPFIGAALHWCYKAKLLYRTMDELHLLRDWQCVRYIEGLATVSKQLTNWFKYEKRREQKDEPPNGNT